MEKANKSDYLTDYLDLTFIIDSGGKLSTRLYDKRDDFDFHIVNFPILSSNIPSGPSYGHKFRSSSDMQDTARITMLLDIAPSAWLIDFCHKAILPCDLRSLLRNFMVDVRI